MVLDPPVDVTVLVDLYNEVLSWLLDTYAPEVERRIPDRPTAPWMSEEVLQARQARR